MKHLIKIGATVAMGAPAGSPFPLLTTDYRHTADWLACHGFDSMEIHIRTPDMVNGPELAAHCHNIGMEVSSIGTGMAYGMEGLSLTSPSKDIRKAAIQRLKEQMDLSRCFQCPVIIGSMRGVIEKGETFNDVDSRMVESMVELADYAHKTDTELVIEAIDRFETNYLKTADDVLSLIGRVGSDRVLVHLDTYHMNLEEKDWRSPIIRCGKRLGHVHVADNTRYYPGWGLIDFRPIISYLLEIGYDRSLTLECYPVPNGEESVLAGLKHLEAVMSAYSGR